MNDEHDKARELWITLVKEAKAFRSKMIVEAAEQKLQELDIESRNEEAKAFRSRVEAIKQKVQELEKDRESPNEDETFSS
jgi:hypothetical protein